MAFSHFRRSSPSIQLLLLNSFTINLGFFMLYPYLTVYFRDDLGFAAATIGLILGVRVLSQQGMTIFGGTIADRVGYKFAILLGLTLRASGFAAMVLAESFPTVLAAAVLGGLGGAVFSPAGRAYMAVSAQGRRAEVFALENAFAQAGMLLGPLVGLALLGFSLRTVALSSAAIFFMLMVLQSRFLPEIRPAAHTAMTSIGAGWGEVLRNRPFILFAIAMFGQFTLLNQLYLGLPLEIERLTGSQTGVSIMFIVSSVFTIAFQVTVTSFLKRRVRPAIAISIGLFIMGLAFVPTVLSASFVDGSETAIDATSTAGLVLIFPLLSAAVLALGMMIATPFALETIPRLGREALTATYFGVYSTASGIGATTGNVLTGIAFDKQDSIGVPGLPWFFMVALGCACGLFMLSLSRRSEFEREESDAAPRARKSLAS